jgi:hypothetical protein
MSAFFKARATKERTEVLEVIWRILAPMVLVAPDEQKFKEIAKEFQRIWNMPLCVGSIDGKHIRIIAPENYGSLYYNYKNYFSLVLLGVYDAVTFTGGSDVTGFDAVRVGRGMPRASVPFCGCGGTQHGRGSFCGAYGVRGSAVRARKRGSKTNRCRNKGGGLYSDYAQKKGV